MPIPTFDRFGLLPGGIHECTIKEIEVDLAWNDNRRRLSALLQKFIAVDLTPRFTTVPPVVLDGSDVSKKDSPSNINLMLELNNLPDADQRPYLEMLAKLSGHRGLLQAVTHHSPLVPDQFSLSPLSLRWMRPSAPGLISPETAACSRQA